jgi:uncharacterized membrane protein
MMLMMMIVRQMLPMVGATILLKRNLLSLVLSTTATWFVLVLALLVLVVVVVVELGVVVAVLVEVATTMNRWVVDPYVHPMVCPPYLSRAGWETVGALGNNICTTEMTTSPKIVNPQLSKSLASLVKRKIRSPVL